MIVVASYGPAGDVTVDLDPTAARPAGELSGVNVETGAAIERTGPGSFKLPLGRHDFCLAKIGPAKQ